MNLSLIGFWLHVRAFISDFTLIALALGCLAGAVALLLVDQPASVSGRSSGSSQMA